VAAAVAARPIQQLQMTDAKVVLPQLLLRLTLQKNAAQFITTA